MNDRLYWTKKWIRQLQARFLGPNVDRNQGFVIETYSAAGNRDVDLHFTDSPERKCVVNDQLIQCSPQIARDFYIDQIEKQIIESGAKTVLEVGCGTSINIFLLSQRLPDVKFQGIDITPARIETGKTWFKENKNFEPNVEVGDVTKLQFEDNEFDLIYSCHCFEQINQFALAGVREIVRVAKKRVALLEPDYKNSNFAQRQFLKNHDYLLNFHKKINSVAPGRLKLHALGTYFNPMNRTGLFEIDVEGFQSPSSS